MSDGHYHDVGDVNGAARDGHSHSPKSLGAAEEHELDRLRQDLRSAEGEITGLRREIREQDRRIEELRSGLAELAGLVADLSGKTAESLEVLSSVVHSLGG